MARGVNKVLAIGNLGQDPDIRFLPSGKPAANFSIAVSESWTDKNTGQKQERTEWIKCVAFNKLAKIAQQYVHMGSLLCIEGRYTNRSSLVGMRSMGCHRGSMMIQPPHSDFCQ